MKSTKQLRAKIKSVSSTLKLTKAMELVASSKIRRAVSELEASREYSSGLEDIAGEVCSQDDCVHSRYIKSDGGDKTYVIVIAGDRGLAGGYNSNIFKKMCECSDVEFLPIGKKACERLRKDPILSEGFSFEKAREISERCCDELVGSEVKKLGIIYTKFISSMKSEVKFKWILPFQGTSEHEKKPIIFEPEPSILLDNIMRLYIASTIFSCVKESYLCEVYARRFAMDSAGKNASEMIDALKLEYNGVRQSIITREINEIMSGSGI